MPDKSDDDTGWTRSSLTQEPVLITFVTLLEGTVLQASQTSLELLTLGLSLKVVVIADDLVTTGFG
jgi:hypothetical protein